MRKSSSEELHQLAIAGGKHSLKDDWDRESAAKREPSRKRGPSKWLEIHDDRNAYGENFDFRIMDGDVFMPTCRAAQEWLYYVMPENMDAFTDLSDFVGYRIPELAMPVVLDAASRDGLIDEADYCAAMNNRDMRAGE